MGAPATSSKGDLKKPATPDSRATYLSLIQQYLAVFQVDNALWLAERCVAEYPQCQEAAYLQALCYYRMGKAKNARACLERQSVLTSSMQYLAAQCCCDLGDYSRGEKILLQGTQTAYKQAKESAVINMDDWILQTTVRTLSLPP
jgi:tetratricopeptide (TPR) repeat protein